MRATSGEGVVAGTNILHGLQTQKNIRIPTKKKGEPPLPPEGQFVVFLLLDFSKILEGG